MNFAYLMNSFWMVVGSKVGIQKRAENGVLFENFKYTSGTPKRELKNLTGEHMMTGLVSSRGIFTYEEMYSIFIAFAGHRMEPHAKGTLRRVLRPAGSKFA